MLIVVDPHSDIPVYKQLMDQIRLLVASGALAAGDELPSTRSLSAELGVNPMTVSKAFSLLEREEIVERRPGRPLVVKGTDEAGRRERRREALRRGLDPAVRVARQLGFAPGEALALFAELLGASRDESGPEEDQP